jgi:ligand-binding sensor domain-containing protein
MQPTLIAFRQCPNSWRKCPLLGLLALVALNPPALLLAQDRPAKFERLGLEQGVSQNAIFCMLQDHQGFMWFGTQDGLNKYDGYSFTVYYHDAQDSSSLSESWITSIYEDRSGTLWVGTSNHGINRYNRETEQFTRFGDDSRDATSLSSKYVASIYEDSASGNKLWIGTDRGLYVFDRIQRQFTFFVNDPQNPHSLSSNNVGAIYEDHTGALWIGTVNGLDKLVLSRASGGVNSSEGSDRDKEQFIHFFHDPKNPYSLSSNSISSIFEDHTGTLWIGTYGGGLNKFNREREQFTHFVNDPKNPHSLSSNGVLRINEGPTGTLWVGTDR